MLQIENVSKTFSGDDPTKRVLALDSINLVVEKGEFISIIGPSGCGKSTLLDLVACLDYPSSGVISVGSERLTRPHGDIGVVFQQDATFPWMTNRKNVEFGLQRQRLTSKERTQRADSALELVGLEQFADHYPAQLSGGMRQRVNIARALAARPQILLMDEPFGALDEQTRLELGDELLNIWRETGSTVMFVTHSLSESALLSDRIVVMTARPGRVQKIVTSPLPKSRTSAVIASSEYAQLNGELWKSLSEGQAGARSDEAKG